MTENVKLGSECSSDTTANMQAVCTHQQSQYIPKLRDVINPLPCIIIVIIIIIQSKNLS